MVCECNAFPRCITLYLSQSGNIPVGIGQVWVHMPKQHVALSTLRKYPMGTRLAIAQTDARLATPISLR